MVDSKEREELFSDYVRDRDKRLREEEKAERKRKRDGFRELLERTSLVKVRQKCGILAQHGKPATSISGLHLRPARNA